MLEKWKKILSNWIKCYSINDNKKVPVNIDSLLDIICYLRDNFNLNESKSSLLEAHTLNEFIVEKYPDFIFENGTPEPVNETDIHIAASLLLFFMCVNSKDLDLKSAMCKELSVEDQEVILKFSKCLMECHSVTYADVLSAIKEACGQGDVDNNQQFAVPETPPAVRGLHNEVRNLKAALDTERFDKNYIQDELNRTNLKLDKLSKEKEEYKLEIVNLKGRISLCCGENRECKESESSQTNSEKLLKQLDTREKELLNIQEQYEDLRDERDLLKDKLEESKREYEKSIALRQEEESRVSQLIQELEIERNNAQALRELVAELQQHNRLNGLDTSQLECDELDASIHLPQNTSVCSEACANVIEVQLGEERAKIVVLNEQIGVLQSQLNDINKIYNDEKLSFASMLSDKENEIKSLSDKINYEVEEKNALKLHFDNEINKLNSNLRDLEQKLRESDETSARIIEAKIQDIQTLQNEKLSLLDSLANVTTKLENVIKGLNLEIETEKSLKMKMREEYENKIMKLNEKVLNRSNELIEFQNKIEEKGEIIEKLQLELRNEKHLKDELSNKYNDEILNSNIQIAAFDENLRQKVEELNFLHKQLQDTLSINSNMKKDTEYLNSCVVQLQDDKTKIEAENRQCIFDIKNRDIKINQLQNDLENSERSFKEMQNKLSCDLNESQATIETLKSQLQDEIEYKFNLQIRLSKIESMLVEKDNRIRETESRNKEVIERLGYQNSKLEEINKELSANNVDYDNTIKEHKQKSEKDIESLNDDISNKIEVIKSITEKLEIERSQTSSLKDSLKQAEQQNGQLLSELNIKIKEVETLELKVQKLSQTINDNSEATKLLESSLKEKSTMFDQLAKDFNTETTRLATKLNENDKIMADLKSTTNSTIETHQVTIQTLQIECKSLTEALQNAQEKQRVYEKEKEFLNNQLIEENYLRSKFEKEYLNKCSQLNNITLQLNEEILRYKDTISTLCNKIRELERDNEEKDNKIQEMEVVTAEMHSKQSEIIIQRDVELDKNKSTFNRLQQENEELIIKLGQNILLHENLMKNKDIIINNIESRLHGVLKDIETQKHNYETYKNECEKNSSLKDEELMEKLTEIKTLKDVILELENCVTEKDKIITCLNIENSKYKEDLFILNTEINSLRQKLEENNHGYIELRDSLDSEKMVKDSLETEKKNLLQENKILLQKAIDDKTQYEVLENERDSLLNEKTILVQELLEEKSVRKLINDEKDMLARELTTCKSVFEEEKASLMQQLKDLDFERIVLEKEKSDFKDAKLEFEEKLATEILSRMQLDKQNNNLIMNNKDLSDQLFKLKETRNKLELEVLDKSDEIAQLNEMKEVLLSDKATLKHENELLLQSSNEIKIEMDKMTTEKVFLTNKLREADEKYSLYSMNTQDEIQNLVLEFNDLKSEYKKLQDTNNSVEVILNSEFTNASDKIKSLDIEGIQKVIDVGSSTTSEKCKYFASVVDLLIQVISEIKEQGDILKQENIDTVNDLEEKKSKISQLELDLVNLRKSVEEYKTKLSHLKQTYNTTVEATNKDIQVLQADNQSLNNELTTHKIKLEEKVHSLKEKLIDNENLTDKLKKTYECQIDNLNLMITKLSNYLKEKTTELEGARKEIEQLQINVEEKTKTIKCLEEEVKVEKHNQEKLIGDFESERLVLKNMVTVTESIMEDQKVSSHKSITIYEKTIESLNQEIELLKSQIETEKGNAFTSLQEKEFALECIVADLHKERNQKETIESELNAQIKLLNEKKSNITTELKSKNTELQGLLILNKQLCEELDSYKSVIAMREAENTKLKVTFEELKQDLKAQYEDKSKIENLLLEKIKCHDEFINQITTLENDKEELMVERDNLKRDLKEVSDKVIMNEENEQKLIDLMKEKTKLINILEEKYAEITRLESLLKTEHKDNKSLQDSLDSEKLNNTNKCSLLQEEGFKKEKEIELLKTKLMSVLRDKEECISKLTEEKDAVINELNKQLTQERDYKQKSLKEIYDMTMEISELRNKLLEMQHESDTVKMLRKENEELFKLVGQRETFAVSQEKSKEPAKQYEYLEKEQRHNQKQLFHEQISVFKDKQKEEIASLERELLECKKKLKESSQAYEDHIRALTTELWNVGEKFLVQKGEAEWLKKSQRSGSLMSLQHVHSGGLVAPSEESHRQSDTHSLRSLPVHSHNNKGKENRGVHMSDEEGEVFDNRYLRELASTPRGPDAPQRLSELRWRNSLCPPHLKSSYPAETQFAALREEDIKCAGAASLVLRPQRKEVGITAYKKPGPPTPSKQAGRLSATDSELRESLRVEAEPTACSRKTSTPSRLRALFRTGRPDEGTPRSRRLSNLFRKK
ncbi:GRIP and coiled-coil domain-containing protein 2-like isoform X2 [Leptidea sinapis]|uniref:GRIP and coiled-coil domain-containing protein 2-like isoform X2 n=1 Tax=Leptidea sinapis TaxID=189913 RepID=UPI0021C3FCA3|nr:GRIP and coiled-coil domain-containing protein 2-like isoform X2 [Leptidea sinapis]